MGTGAKVGIMAGVAFAGLVVFVLSSYFSHANTSVDYETQIEFRVENNQQILGQGRLKVTEIASVTGLRASEVGEVWGKVMDGRYKNGAGQMMLWIKEQNPDLSSDVYENIQREVGAFRDKFTAEQRKTGDICRGYAKFRRQPYSGFWVRVSGYPSAEYEAAGGKKLCRLVTSKEAKEAFDTGMDTAIDFNK